MRSLALLLPAALLAVFLAIVTSTTDEPPRVEIIKPLPTCYEKNRPLPIVFKVDDDHGITRYEIYMDGRYVLGYSFTTLVKGTIEAPPAFFPRLRPSDYELDYGEHTIKVVVKDASGQTAVDQMTFRVCPPRV